MLKSVQLTLHWPTLDMMSPSTSGYTTVVPLDLGVRELLCTARGSPAIGLALLHTLLVGTAATVSKAVGAVAQLARPDCCRSERSTPRSVMKSAFTVDGALM